MFSAEIQPSKVNNRYASNHTTVRWYYGLWTITYDPWLAMVDPYIQSYCLLFICYTLLVNLDRPIAKCSCAVTSTCYWRREVFLCQIWGKDMILLSMLFQSLFAIILYCIIFATLAECSCSLAFTQYVYAVSDV